MTCLPTRCSRIRDTVLRSAWLPPRSPYSRVCERAIFKLGAINAYETVACRILYYTTDRTGGSSITCNLDKELAHHIPLRDTTQFYTLLLLLAEAAIVTLLHLRIPHSHCHELTLNTTRHEPFQRPLESGRAARPLRRQ